MASSMDLMGLLRLAAAKLNMPPERLLDLVASGKLGEILGQNGQEKLSVVMRHPEKAAELLDDPTVTEAVRKWQDGQ